MASVHEQLSEQFYKWEIRGRGWQMFEDPVHPEPPFRPFHGHFISAAPVEDDGRSPGFLSSLFGGGRRKTESPVEPEEEPEPRNLFREKQVELLTALPADLDIGKEAIEHLFRNLSECREPVAFELLGTHKRVVAQFAASEDDAPQVRRQLAAHFPDVQFRQSAGVLEDAWETSEGQQAFAVEFGLESEFMLPLATGKIDPFVGIVGALAEMHPGELGLFQVLWQRTRNPWPESIVNSVTHADGKPFFVNQPELASAAESKVASALYAAVVRILVRTKSSRRLNEVVREMAGALRAYENPDGNALVPLHNEDYPSPDTHILDVLSRQSRRSGMILNSSELAAFVHLPSSAVCSPALLRDLGQTKRAPETMPDSKGLVIGDNEHNGESVPVLLSNDQRVRHTHIIGKSGTGKSSLLLNMIRQDIERNDGIAVFDPHGDLIENILSIIPDRRMNDVVLVDLADDEYSIGFNLLQANDEDERRLLASDLVDVFRRLSRTWGDQMDTVLQNAILAILKSSRGGNLADLRRFLRDPKFRNEFLLSVRDPEVRSFWLETFPGLGATKSVNSLLARLQDFFSQEPIRNMVSQRENKLKFDDIMDNGRIFLAKLSAGLGGRENAYLLGSLLVSKFQQMAMARQKQKAADRRYFWLYVDEFQHFISPSMEEILTGLRKYRIGLTLSHHSLQQLQKNSAVADAVMSQPCTRIVFNVGDEDAKKLGEGFASFDDKAIKKLENYHAIARVERNNNDFNLATRKPVLPPEAEAEARRERMILASREKYARPRAEVEEELLAQIPVPAAPRTDESKPAIKTPEPAPPPMVPSPVPKVQKAVVIPPEKTASTTISEKTELPVSAPKVSPAGVKRPPAEPKQSEIGVAADKIPKELGKGQALHVELQKQIQLEARKRGITTDMEKRLTKSSMQSADVVFTKLNMAVEVAVTCSVSHEFGNIKKCLEAGFVRVFSVCLDAQKLADIATAVRGGLGDRSAAKVSCFTMDEMLAELAGLAKIEAAMAKTALPPGTENIEGTIVEDIFPEPSPSDTKQQEDITFGLVADIMRRSRPKKKKPGK